MWLLDHTLIRIGNNEYARSDESYGITTLRDDHVDIGTATLRFRFTGKSGTVRTVDPPTSPTEAKRQVREAVNDTAVRLRNTAAVCRRSYVHPVVIESHADGTLHEIGNGRHPPSTRRWLSDEELGLLTLLEP